MMFFFISQRKIQVDQVAIEIFSFVSSYGLAGDSSIYTQGVFEGKRAGVVTEPVKSGGDFGVVFVE